jgi:hypothetical protein
LTGEMDELLDAVHSSLAAAREGKVEGIDPGAKP